jgi:hypothetical protein
LHNFNRAAFFEGARLHKLAKKNTQPSPHPKRSDRQVHPTARSKLPCHPNDNATLFWFHPKVLHHFEKGLSQLRACLFFRKLFSRAVNAQMESSFSR